MTTSFEFLQPNRFGQTCDTALERNHVSFATIAAIER